MMELELALQVYPSEKRTDGRSDGRNRLHYIRLIVVFFQKSGHFYQNTKLCDDTHKIENSKSKQYVFCPESACIKHMNIVSNQSTVELYDIGILLQYNYIFVRAYLGVKQTRPWRYISAQPVALKLFEQVHEIPNNVVCATSKFSDQPAHTRSLIRAFASRLTIL